MALVDFVRTFHGNQSSLRPNPKDVSMTVGHGLSSSAVCMCHVVVYEVVMSTSQLQRIGKCNDFVSGNTN